MKKIGKKELLPKVGDLGDQLKKELQVVVGCITYFQNKGSVYEKTWQKMEKHMDMAIELYNDMRSNIRK